MRELIIILTCMAVGPLGFAQTNTAQTASARSSKGNTAETSAPVATGNVVIMTALIPGRSIAVSTSGIRPPVNYVLSKDVRYVNLAGKEIKPSLIRPGTRVRLERTGNEKTVGRVVVVEP